MGRGSTKKNKNIYFLSREAAQMTRAQASEAMVFISESRIEKIESEKITPHPEDVLEMARAYKKPSLCNHYCSQLCSIGQQYVPEVKIKDLPQIVLEMLATLNLLNKDKERLIEITVDGQISDDEYGDFAKIQDTLERISLTVDALRLWVDNTIAAGAIDKKRLESYRPER